MSFHIGKVEKIGMDKMARKNDSGHYDCTACKEKDMQRTQARKHFMEVHG